MTITPWELYWIFQLDQINNVFKVICFFSSQAFWILSVILLFTNDLDESKMSSIVKKKLKTIYIYTCIVTAFSILMVMFMPTTKQMTAIKVLPAIVNSEFVQQEVPNEIDELYTMAKEYMKECLTNKK